MVALMYGDVEIGQLEIKSALFPTRKKQSAELQTILS